MGGKCGFEVKPYREFTVDCVVGERGYLVLEPHVAWTLDVPSSGASLSEVNRPFVTVSSR